MMKPRIPVLVTAGLFAAALLLALTILSPRAAAQTASTGTPAATTAETKTPAPTRTPAPSPASTATLTAPEAKARLAETYIKAGDYTKAVDVFSTMVAENPGNPAAWKGLEGAIFARATATAMAAQKPSPTPSPTATAAPGFAGTFRTQWNTLAGTALAGLVLILLVYAVAKGLVLPGLVWLRDQFYTRVLVWLKQKPQLPPVFIGEFVDATQIRDLQGSAVVTQALTECLVLSGESVPKWATSVEPAPALDLGAMAWIKLLWGWIVPPPRGYRIGGVLLADAAYQYRLTIQRLDLARHAVDASYSFTSTGTNARTAFKSMARLAAVWVRRPAEIEAEVAAEAAKRKETASAAAGAVVTLESSISRPKGSELHPTSVQEPDGTPSAIKPTSEIFDEALTALRNASLLVRQGAGQKKAAADQLKAAEDAISALQASPRLRDDLREAIEAVRQQVGTS